MSPFNKIDIILTQAQMDGIQDGIAMIKENLSPQFNLTKKERGELPNIANARYPYGKRAIEQHGPNNPKIVEGTFYGTLAGAQNDMTFYDQMNPFKLQLLQLVEIFTDTQHVAGHEVWEWVGDFYNSAQRAAESNVPGSDAVVDDLKTIFDRPNQGGDDPNPDDTPDPVDP